MLFYKPVLFLTVLLLPFSNYAQKATYIANGGVLVEVGNSKVIIDGVFEDGLGKFSTPSESTLNDMIAGNAPYDQLSLVLATHSHPDHISGSRTLELLTAQKTLKLITTPQSIDSIKLVSDDFASVQGQLISYPLSRSYKLYDSPTVRVKSAYTKHGGRANANVQNMIFIISMNGKKILHLGDADMDLERYNALNLSSEEFDIAFVPFWYMTGLYGTEMIKKFIHAKKIVAVRLPENTNQKTIDKIGTYAPSAILFQHEGQNVIF